MLNEEQIQKDRGAIYGDFAENVRGVSAIIDAMVGIYEAKNGDKPNSFLVAEWHYMAIKLARIAATPCYHDSYTDLAIYAKLIRDEHLPCN